MLLKAEFDENMSNLERSVDDMLAGGEGKILILILAPWQYNCYIIRNPNDYILNSIFFFQILCLVKNFKTSFTWF